MRTILAVALFGALAGSLHAQRFRTDPLYFSGGNAISGRSGLGAPQLPPGTGLNGLRGPQNLAGVNGLPAFSNRYYQYGCSDCSLRGTNGTGCSYSRNSNNSRNSRYGRDSRGSYVTVVPVFGGYGFPGIFDEAPAEPPPVDPSAIAVTNELDQLRSEVDQLKAQTAEPAPQPAAPATAQVPAAPLPPEPATVIVLNDGRRIESTNYAVMDQTLWNFSAHPVQKIPLKAVDVAASQKANSANGVEFSVPAAN